MYFISDNKNKMWTWFQGNIALEKSKRRKPFGWMPDEGWEDCNRLAAEFSEAFGTLLDDVERNEKVWKMVSRFVCKGVKLIMNFFHSCEVWWNWEFVAMNQ